MESFKATAISMIPYGWHRRLLDQDGLDFSVQVWLEKAALAGIVREITGQWDVPLYVPSGYSSLTFLHDAAQDLERQTRTFGRQAIVLQMGDYDPSGQDALRAAREDIEKLAPVTVQEGIQFFTIAVTPEQITEMNLPTRPTKKSDTRAAGFSEESVELDAIEPNELRRLVDEEIEACFPDGIRERLREQVEREREEITEWLTARMRD
jgi:hypothetical protein